MGSRIISLALFATLGSSAHAGQVLFEAFGTVTYTEAVTGLFVDAVPGDPAYLAFRVDTPGVETIPGHGMHYWIDVPSVGFSIGNVSTVATSSSPFLGVENDYPTTVDAFRLVSIHLAGANIGAFGFADCSGAMLTSTDLTTNLGTWPSSILCYQAWAMNGGGFGFIHIQLDAVRLSLVAPTGVPYCFGDGSGTPCPCQPGLSGRGCPNSANPDGALLSALGSASVADDRLVLEGTGMPASTTCIYFQANERTSVAFGDGVRCTAGPVVRLAQRTCSLGRSLYPTPGETTIAEKCAAYGPALALSPGDLRRYQCMYRDAARFCIPAATFNLTNAVEVVWL